jgi:hypothetical protein
MGRLAVVLLAALLFAPCALAGGDFVDLTVAGGSAWFVGPFGIREVDAATGRTRYAPQPVEDSYPQSVALAGGAAWVATVANGFVDGKLVRIDRSTHRTRIVLRVPKGSVLYVAAGAGGVYALVGLRSGSRIVRLAPTGAVTRTWRIPDAGRMAADASGCWVSGTNRLVHIDPQGRLHSIPGIGFGDVATGGGSVWVSLLDSIVRVDERTGAVRTLRTGPLHLGGFQHDVAVGDGALWTLAAQPGSLQRRDLGTGRVVRSVRLPDIPDAVVPTPSGVWVAIAISHRLLRFDPRSLRRTLSVAVL